MTGKVDEDGDDGAVGGGEGKSSKEGVGGGEGVAGSALLRLESVRVRADWLAGVDRHEFISRRRPSNASSRSVWSSGEDWCDDRQFNDGRGEGSEGGS